MKNVFIWQDQRLTKQYHGKNMTTIGPNKEHHMPESNSNCSSDFDFEAKVHISKEVMAFIISTIGLIITNLLLN